MEKSDFTKEKLTVGIVGLGLIGGSMAKAYKAAGHVVLATDISDTTTEFAILAEIIDGKLSSANFSVCDIILIAVYPDATVEYIKRNAEYFPQSGLVMDLCGTKKEVCLVAFAEAAKHGFTFVGGHPMAGTHNSGLKFSRADMFRGAPMVIVPPVFDDIMLLDRVKKLLAPAEFGFFSVTTAEDHDRMIAFTSQLAHVVSSAYIKSPTATEHRGFSAGSYKDMTRVAWLNPDMWSELFLENREHLLYELDTIIANLTDYRNAIDNKDAPCLKKLLDEGRKRKEEVDGNGKNKS